MIKKKLMGCIFGKKEQETNSFGRAVEAMSQSTQDLMMFSHELKLINSRLNLEIRREDEKKQFESLIMGSE